jgi:hypothetical protein
MNNRQRKKQEEQKRRQEGQRRREEEARRRQGEETVLKVEQLGAAMKSSGVAESNGSVEVPTTLDLARLQECYRKAEAARISFEKAQRALADREARAESREQEIFELSSTVESGRTELQRDRDAFAKESDAQAAKGRDLDAREAEIAARERDAKAEFAELRSQEDARAREEARELEQKIDELKRQCAEQQATLDGQADVARKRLDEELEQIREEARATIKAEGDELERQKQSVAAEQRQVRQERRQLDLDRQMLEDDQQGLQQRVQALAAAEVERERRNRQSAEDRLQGALADLQDREARLREFEERERGWGGRSADHFEARIRQLEAENAQLREDAAGHLDTHDGARLKQLEAERDDWRRERARLFQENEEFRARLDKQLVGKVQLETLRDQTEAYRTANESLRQSLTELRQELDRGLKAASDRTPFPACVAMDGDEQLQAVPSMFTSIPDLAKFVEFVRHRMAWDPFRKKELYYSARDIRVFLGGLAMSRLHILQGISGTGKTSLPEAFARAIGAGHKVVAVQAGWRDRQDLMGHYNAFERRFSEQLFLKGLYEAQCPLHRERPYLIVLDEMNLSRPEQYFADFLSGLEQGRPDPIDLMPAPLSPSPKLLRDGHRLPWASNVWFLGTANHDETTVEFADKTYDRAHVMELPLPRDRETFEVQKDHKLQKPVSLSAIQAAFEQARTQHLTKADQACRFLLENLAEPLGRDFRVGWGNRLEEHMRWFAPVVIAGGGSIGEAVDHLVATKLLRKVRDRHDISSGDLKRLHEVLRASWDKLDRQNPPLRSLDLLEREQKRVATGEMS